MWKRINGERIVLSRGSLGERVIWKGVLGKREDIKVEVVEWIFVKRSIFGGFY
jgi:hypothetical protein